MAPQNYREIRILSAQLLFHRKYEAAYSLFMIFGLGKVSLGGKTIWRLCWEDRVELMGGRGRKMRVRFFGGGDWRKEPLGRTRRRGDDNIKMDQMIIEWERLYYVYLSLKWDRWQVFVIKVMKFCVLSDAEKFFRPVECVLYLQEGICSIHLVKDTWRTNSVVCTNYQIVVSVVVLQWPGNVVNLLRRIFFSYFSTPCI